MKLIIVAVVALAALVVAAPPEPVKIVRSEFKQEDGGAYTFSFESEDGSSRVENGEVKQVVDEENNPHKVVVVRGSYSYKDSDGILQTVNYIADEEGYQAEGEIIPKPARR